MQLAVHQRDLADATRRIRTQRLVAQAAELANEGKSWRVASYTYPCKRRLEHLSFRIEHPTGRSLDKLQVKIRDDLNTFVDWAPITDVGLWVGGRRELHAGSGGIAITQVWGALPLDAEGDIIIEVRDTVGLKVSLEGVAVAGLTILPRDMKRMRDDVEAKQERRGLGA